MSSSLARYRGTRPWVIAGGEQGCAAMVNEQPPGVGGTTPDTHGRPHGLRLQGRPSPREEALRGTILLGASRKTWGGYPEDVTRSVRIRTIP